MGRYGGAGKGGVSGMGKATTRWYQIPWGTAATVRAALLAPVLNVGTRAGRALLGSQASTGVGRARAGGPRRANRVGRRRLADGVLGLAACWDGRDGRPGVWPSGRLAAVVSACVAELVSPCKTGDQYVDHT